MCGEFEGVQKYVVSLCEILDKEREETLGLFVIEIFLDVFAEVLVIADDQWMADFL